MIFPFNDAENTATIVCTHVINENKPILFVSHDEDDGMWQFLCGQNHNTEDALLVSLKHVFDKDNSISEIADLPLGYTATRKSISDSWRILKNY